MMLKQKHKYIVVVLLLCAIILSCGEIPVDSVDYIREMNSFITNSLDGQELYSTNLYPEDIPFAMDESDDLYFYQVDGVSRIISYDSLDLYGPNLSVYEFRDVVAVIDDDFTGKIYRIRNNDTTMAYKFESSLQRFAYFLKRYSNTYQYHGWRFKAYSCLNYSIDGSFASEGGFTFNAKPTNAIDLPNYRLGRYYIVKDSIAELPLGDSITFSTIYKERLFYKDRSDSIKTFNTVLDNGTYYTGMKVPSASDEYFQLITFDSNENGRYFRVDTLSADGGTVVVESTLVKQGDYVIPFIVDI